MNVDTPRGTDWTELVATADDTARVATHAAVAGASHMLTKITASYDEAAIGLLTISNGSTELHIHVYSSIDIDFPTPYDPGKGNAIVVTLAAGGSGVGGILSMAGYSAF